MKPLVPLALFLLILTLGLETWAALRVEVRLEYVSCITEDGHLLLRAEGIPDAPSSRELQKPVLARAEWYLDNQLILKLVKEKDQSPPQLKLRHRIDKPLKTKSELKLKTWFYVTAKSGGESALVEGVPCSKLFQTPNTQFTCGWTLYYPGTPALNVSGQTANWVKVTLNGESLPVSSEGRFDRRFYLTEPGEATYVLKCDDPQTHQSKENQYKVKVTGLKLKLASPRLALDVQGYLNWEVTTALPCTASIVVFDALRYTPVARLFTGKVTPDKPVSGTWDCRPEVWYPCPQPSGFIPAGDYVVSVVPEDKEASAAWTADYVPLRVTSPEPLPPYDWVPFITVINDKRFVAPNWTYTNVEPMLLPVFYPTNETPAELSFTGTGVEVLCASGPGHTALEIRLDGRAAGKLDTNAPLGLVVWQSGPLSYGKHSLKLTPKTDLIPPNAQLVGFRLWPRTSTPGAGVPVTPWPQLDFASLGPPVDFPPPPPPELAPLPPSTSWSQSMLVEKHLLAPLLAGLAVFVLTLVVWVLQSKKPSSSPGRRS